MQKTLHTKEYKRLTSWLKSKRIERGLTVRELADKLGVAHSFVGKVEQCERRLDIVEYVNYCEALEEPALGGLKVIAANSTSRKNH